ncbi:formylglycine-generating enzyme family protein [Verrucomicrobiota bacterium]
MKKLFVCALIALLLAGTAGAWIPSEWVWFSWPFAYSSNEAGWHYMNEGDQMWCIRLDTGQWLVLSRPACGLSHGWSFCLWPFAYSLDDDAWYYLNETDVQWCFGLATGTWSLFGRGGVTTTTAALPTTTTGSVPTTTTVATTHATTTAVEMVLIPAGSFQMGNCMPPGDGYTDEIPVHTVMVSAFDIDRYEVTKALWDQVAEWAQDHGYDIGPEDGLGKATDHPVQTATWCGCVKWCNARSEKEGLVPAYYISSARATVYRTGDVNVSNDWVRWTAGYRLATEAEWEKAARGGVAGHRFPWSESDSISHSRANYYAGVPDPYDESHPAGHHPTYADGVYPYTSPVGSFAANGYGLYDLAGNVWEWCWDWYSWDYYSLSPGTDPLGPSSGSFRVARGGSWASTASNCRVAHRAYSIRPDTGNCNLGFRAVLPVP